MKKRIMNLTDKEKAKKYVCEKVVEYETNKNNIYLIYLSKDNKIIMYEHFQTEDIVVCNKVKIGNKSYKEKRYNCSYDVEPLIWYLSDFLDTFYNRKYSNKILEDCYNTDLEEYEEYKVMKWSE